MCAEAALVTRNKRHEALNFFKFGQPTNSDQIPKIPALDEHVAFTVRRWVWDLFYLQHRTRNIVHKQFSRPHIAIEHGIRSIYRSLSYALLVLRPSVQKNV